MTYAHGGSGNESKCTPSFGSSSSLCLAMVMAALMTTRSCGAAINIKATYGIFGAIQSVDTTTTASRLLETCYSGFSLNDCEDWNATVVRKAQAFASQFTDRAQRTQPYCLQCCTKPVPIATGADETWNLSCPLNDLQRLSVSKGRRTFRFARRLTVDTDDGIVDCAMPDRTPSTYLTGYALTVWIIERSSALGRQYWRTVVNCSAAITESAIAPTIFNEVIRVRSVPTAQSRPTAWLAPTLGVVAGVLVLLSVPVVNAGWRGQRCRHCGSWLVVVNSMCVACIVISWRLQPPPAKVYVENGDPCTSPIPEEDEEEDDDSDEEDDEEEG